jgi:hypothetical protein
MPGAVRAELPRGTVVRLLNRAPLSLEQGRETKTWRAIVPPAGDVRHIQAAGVRVDRAAHSSAGPVPALARSNEIQASYASGASAPLIPPEVADALAQIESAHRAIVRDSVELWRLDGIRQRYESLLRSVTDKASGNEIRARLEIVARHEALARDARQIETLLRRSRRRDASLALDERRLVDAQQPQAQPYSAVGLIQASSRKVGGQKVFALINRDGATEAYLDIPPGIELRRLMTHRVGVRGTVNYNEALRARVITVRDVEPIDQP